MPIVPQGDFTDKELGKFIYDLSEAHWDCEDSLQDVKALLEVNGVEITDVRVTGQKEPESWLEKIGIR